MRRHHTRLTVLREEGLRCGWVSTHWCCGGRRVAFEPASRRTILAPTALERTAVNLISAELADGHGGVLVSIHLDEGEAAISLEASLGDVAEVLEERHEIVLRRVRGEIADVDRGLPLWRLTEDHLKGLSTLGWEAVVAVRGGRCHAHLCHSLLLGVGRLSFLVRPVAPDSTRSEPLAVHGAERFLCFSTVAVGDESVPAGATSLHVPHNTCFRDGTEGRECLHEHFIVDLVGKIADEDVEVVRGVLLGSVAGLIGPIDTNLLLVHTPTVQRL